MLTERQGERLPDWLDAAGQDDLPSLHALAIGITRDLDAVIAGLTLAWNSGAVEGHVNRIKMLKRQMFGRAGVKLLRKRVLHACAGWLSSGYFRSRKPGCRAHARRNSAEPYAAGHGSVIVVTMPGRPATTET